MTFSKLFGALLLICALLLGGCAERDDDYAVRDNNNVATRDNREMTGELTNLVSSTGLTRTTTASSALPNMTRV